MISRELYALIKLMHEQWILGPFLIFSNGPGNEANVLWSMWTLVRCCRIRLIPKWNDLVTSLSLSLFYFSYLFVFVFASLVLQGVDCALLGPHTLLPWASVYDSTLSNFLVCWSQYETMISLATLQCWGWVAFLSVTDVCVADSWDEPERASH